MLLKEIQEVLETLAPVNLAAEYDNVGLLVGDAALDVKKALLALDCTPAAVDDAKRLGANLIITHHPVIFNPLRRIEHGSLVYGLIQAGISVLSMHTNLDAADGGVNDCLADALELDGVRGLEPIVGAFMGRIGTLKEPMTADAFAAYVKERLNLEAVRYVCGRSEVRTVGLCAGSGVDLIPAAVAAGADAFVCGDVKHAAFLQAAATGLTLVDGTHFGTEDVVIEPLCRKLREQLPSVEFFTNHCNVIKTRR